MMDKNPDLSLLYRYQEARRRLTACEVNLPFGRGKGACRSEEPGTDGAAGGERLKAECNRLKRRTERLEGGVPGLRSATS